MVLRAIDLFAGAGGLSNGFLQTGQFNIKVAVEIDKHSQATYKKNHPGTDIMGNIKKIDFKNDIKSKYGPIDVVIGGPPCQGFSNANRQSNTLISNNNELMKYYIKAIEELRPKALIMENVKTLRSKRHKFFCSANDIYELHQLGIKTVSEIVPLGDGSLFTSEINNIISNVDNLRPFIIHKELMSKLNTLFRHAKKQNSSNLTSFLMNNNNRKFFGRVFREKEWEFQKTACWNKDYELVWNNARDKIIEFIDGVDNKEELKRALNQIVEIQKIFMKYQELIDNNIICDGIQTKGNIISVQIRTYNIFEYIVKKLKSLGYRINEDNRYILNAADYGVPQVRNRLFILGVNESVGLEKKVELPAPVIKNEKDYFNIQDAISDLEDIEPDVNPEDRPIIRYPKHGFNQDESLLNYLINGLFNEIYNHVRTNTTEVALNRFKALKEGQNFHNLNEHLKSTYSNHTRTQNTIYKRLVYSKPSDTVVNVRKSMWIHPTKDRAISIREAARLQSFQDSFVFQGSKNSQYQQVGNAVPPLLAKAVAEQLVKLLEQIPSDQSRLIKA